MALRMEFHPAVFGGLDGFFGQVGHFDEPLVGEHRLDGSLAAVAVADLGFVGFFLFQQSGGRQVFDDLLAGDVAFHAGVWTAVFVDGAVGVEDVEDVDLVGRVQMPLPRRIVVGVVGGGHFHHAGAECRIDENVVGDNRDEPIDQR